MQRLKMLSGLLVIIQISLLLVYTKVLHFDFISTWDDDVYVIYNEIIKTWNFDNLKAIFQSDTGGNYHPITLLSLALDYKIYGGTAYGYHLTNLLLHAFNTTLVFFFIYRLSTKKAIAAFCASMLFAIHPMHVESIAWISERKDVLFLFFFLGGMLSYITHFDSKKMIYYYLSLFLSILSMLSKPTAVIFPLIIMLLDYYKIPKINKKTLILKIPFFLAALVVSVITIISQSNYDALAMADNFSLPRRLIFACDNLWTYLKKAILPINMAAFYPYPDPKSLATLSLSPFILATIIGLLWYYNKKLLNFGFLFFAIALLPVLQIIPAGSSMISERYTYLPYIGLYFVIGMYMDDWTKQHKLIKLTLFMAICACLAWQSYQRLGIWKNDLSFWQDWIAKDIQTHRAYTSLGTYQYRNGHLEDAEIMYNKALHINPNYTKALTDRGELRSQLQLWDSALNDFNRALKNTPENHELYSLRGAAYFHLGELEKARTDFEKGLELNPDFTNLYFNRAALYSFEGRHEDALKDYSVVLSQEPNNHESWYSRSVVYCKLKNYKKALDDINSAIQLIENDGSYHHLRTFIYYKMEKFNLAKEDAIIAQKNGRKLEDYLLEVIKD